MILTTSSIIEYDNNNGDRYIVLSKILNNNILRRRIFEYVYNIHKKIFGWRRTRPQCYRWYDISDRLDKLLECGMIDVFKERLDIIESKYSNYKWCLNHTNNNDSSNRYRFIPNLERIIEVLCNQSKMQPTIFTFNRSKELVDIIFNRYGHLKEIYNLFDQCTVYYSSFELFKYIFENYTKFNSSTSKNDNFNHYLSTYYINQLNTMNNNNNEKELYYLNQLKISFNQLFDQHKKESNLLLIKVLELVLESTHPQVRDTCIKGNTSDEELMDKSARVSLEVFELMDRYGVEIECTTKTLENAARNGYLDVVQYLHTKRNIKLTDSALYQAVHNDHLDIVIYLMENGPERLLSKSTWDLCSYPDVLNYLVKSGYIGLEMDVFSDMRHFNSQVRSYYQSQFDQYLQDHPEYAFEDQGEFNNDLYFPGDADIDDLTRSVRTAIETRDFNQLELIVRENPDLCGNRLGDMLFQQTTNDMDAVPCIYLSLVIIDDLEMIRFLIDGFNGAYYSPHWTSHNLTEYITIPTLEYFINRGIITVTPEFILAPLDRLDILNYLLNHLYNNQLNNNNEMKLNNQEDLDYLFASIIKSNLLLFTFQNQVFKGDAGMVKRIMIALEKDAKVNDNGELVDDQVWKEELKQFYSSNFTMAAGYHSREMIELLLDCPYILPEVHQHLFDRAIVKSYGKFSIDNAKFLYEKYPQQSITTVSNDHQYITNQYLYGDFEYPPFDLLRFIYFNWPERDKIIQHLKVDPRSLEWLNS